MTVRRVAERRWRRRVLAAAAGALLVIASGCASHPASTGSGGATSSTPSAESTKDIDTGTAQRLDAAINQAMSAASVPGAIIGVWGPDGRYVRTFGVADKATGAPMNVDMYSRIGSETKTFTVTAVLQLADQGKLALDDPIGKYIDGVPGGDQITLRELARMQSGLYNYSATTAFQQALFAGPQRNFTPQELLGYAFAEHPVFAPGQGFQYSNTNTVLLGLVVEKVGGQPLPDYIHDHIVAPLNMSHTSFPTTNAFTDPHPQGYTNQTANGAVVTSTDWNPSWGWAAGAMISTLDDLHTWAPAVATGKLLSPAMQAQRLQTVNEQGLPPQDGYGLGIFNLGGWIGHNGSLPGYQSVVVYLPDQKRTLVILINTDIEYRGSEPGSMLATAITSVISPDHVYRLGPEVQPDVSGSSTPTKPR
jgi:D-alanyl-D-alanine carboxypeptidase